LRLLRNAKPLHTEFGLLHVVSAEGLIGLKLQGYVNNPRRTRDLEDIRSLIAANRANETPEIVVRTSMRTGGTPIRMTWSGAKTVLSNLT
jgi:hypothetical protein